MYIFDNQSEFYRYPQGGIEAGQEIILKIYIRKNVESKPIIKIEKRQDLSSSTYMDIPMEWISTKNSYDLYKGSFTINDYGQYFYSFVLNERIISKNYEFLIYKKNYITPQWIKGGIVYHIFVDRFHRNKILYKRDDIIIRDDWGGIPNFLPDKDGEIRNNDFFGGNLEGIIEKLPYISELGVNTIYLSPIFEAYSNHKYDVGDYLKIDPMFGDEKTLSLFCREAEKLGIGIIIDGVFSHTGDDSVYFNKYGNYNSLGAYQSKASPYYNWYMFNSWMDDYISWWGIKTLPTINKENEDYIDYITGENGVLKYWQKAGIKGWRLDVADELPNEFLERLRRAVKEQDSEAYIVGEVWEDGSNKISYGKLKEYFCGNQLDSVTNYPLKNAIIDYVKNKDCTALYETMNFIIEKYPPQIVNCLMNILGTHDTARILTVLGCTEAPLNKEQKATFKLNEEELKEGISLLKIASLLQFTLPGIPCIYYGDEVGIEGFEDPFNRACYPWGNENKELIEHYKYLSALRKNELFSEAKYKCIIHDGGVFAFERYNELERIVIAVNMSEEIISLRLNQNMIEYSSNITKELYNISSGDYLILYRTSSEYHTERSEVSKV